MDSVVFMPQYRQQMSPLDSVFKYVAVLMPPHVCDSVVEEMAFKCSLESALKPLGSRRPKL